VPVTIAPGDYARWLDGDATDAGEAVLLLRAPDDGEFVWHEVSTRVNRAAVDDAQLLLPISEEQAAAEAEAPKVTKRAAARKAAPAASGDGQGSLF
jgi:hypothetical protein